MTNLLFYTANMGQSTTLRQKQWFRWQMITRTSNMATQTGSTHVSKSLKDIVKISYGNPMMFDYSKVTKI